MISEQNHTDDGWVLMPFYINLKGCYDAKYHISSQNTGRFTRTLLEFDWVLHLCPPTNILSVKKAPKDWFFAAACDVWVESFCPEYDYGSKHWLVRGCDNSIFWISFQEMTLWGKRRFLAITKNMMLMNKFQIIDQELYRKFKRRNTFGKSKN